MFGCLFVWLFVCLFDCLFIYLAVCLFFVWLFVCLFGCLFIYLAVCLFVWLFVCFCLAVCLFGCLFVCLDVVLVCFRYSKLILGHFEADFVWVIVSEADSLCVGHCIRGRSIVYCPLYCCIIDKRCHLNASLELYIN